MQEIVQFVMRHGYLVLFVAVLCEQIGLPVPSGLVLIAAGSLAGLHRMSFLAALGIAVAASLIGDVFWFILGKRRGRSILSLLCRISLEPDTCVRKSENIFAKHQVKALLFSKFVPGLSTVAPPMAAVLNLGLGSFLLYDAAGSALWSGAYMLAGLLFRAELERLAVLVSGIGASLAEVMIALICLYVAVKFVARRRLYRELRTAGITAAELKKMLDSGSPSLIVDLRHPMEWEEGKIPGALLLERDQMEAQLTGVSRELEVVLYCS